jgi:uncharacterized protein YbjQ (UPF0145 family)
MPVLIKKAKQLGADAMVLVDSQSFFTQGPTIKPSSAPATGISQLVKGGLKVQRVAVE